MQKIFSNKNIIKQLHKNYVTFTKMKNIDKKFNDNDFDLEKTKRIISAIIQTSGVALKRSRHLDVTDFLRLLKLFNDKGIHFK